LSLLPEKGTKVPAIGIYSIKYFNLRALTNLSRFNNILRVSSENQTSFSLYLTDFYQNFESKKFED
jgi:hypothetical protein